MQDTITTLTGSLIVRENLLKLPIVVSMWLLCKPQSIVGQRTAIL